MAEKQGTGAEEIERLLDEYGVKLMRSFEGDLGSDPVKERAAILAAFAARDERREGRGGVMHFNGDWTAFYFFGLLVGYWLACRRPARKTREEGG